MPLPFPARRRLTVALATTFAAAAAGGAAPAHASVLDSLFDQQWALHPDEGGLDAQTAWRVTDGSGVVVATLDTGVDETHPDLKGALWTNPGEIPGNGIDDDHDGYVDDVHGVDLVNNDGDPSDDEGHGTHVAGIIAAQPNSIGTRGLAPGAKIMAIKVLDSNRAGNSRTVAQGIRFAIAHGASIINASINGDSPDPALESAIQAADAAGVLLVCSAGNDGRNLDTKPSYPASYREENVISVGASGQDDLLASFSNFGKNSVALAAPGDTILSTARGGGYELRSGTSMASPYVAATAALVRAAAPGLDVADVRNDILAGVKKPSGLLSLLQSGELDPVGALLQAVGPGALTSSQKAPSVSVKAKVKRRSKLGKTLVTWSVRGDGASISRWRVSGPGGKTLVRRAASARGAWVRQRTGRVRVTAIGAGGASLAATTVRLR